MLTALSTFALEVVYLYGECLHAWKMGTCWLMFCTALAYYGLLVGVYVLVCWEGGGGGDGGGGG